MNTHMHTHTCTQKNTNTNTHTTGTTHADPSKHQYCGIIPFQLLLVLVFVNFIFLMDFATAKLKPLVGQGYHNPPPPPPPPSQLNP